MRTQSSKDKIQEALELLNEAAQDKKNEIYDLVGEKYDHLRGLFGESLSNGRFVANGVKKRVLKNIHAEEKKLRQTAAIWNRKIHKEPWMVIGGVALGSLVLGALLRRR